MLCGCEVRDWVLTSTDTDMVLRMQNEAANDELRRRGVPQLVVPSGQLTGDAIAWLPEPETCGPGWLELGTL